MPRIEPRPPSHPQDLPWDGIRLAGVVTCPGYFDVPRGTVIDLSAATALEIRSLAGLVRTAKQHPVRLRLAPGLVYRQLCRALTHQLRPLGGGRFEVSLCSD